MAFNFDWSLFQQAADRKQRNREQLNKDIQGLGQTFADVGKTVGSMAEAKRKQEQQKAMAQTINQMMNDPTLSPQAKSVLPFVAQNPQAWELLTSAMKQPTSAQTVPISVGDQGAFDPNVNPPGGGPKPMSSGQGVSTFNLKPEAAARLLSSQKIAQERLNKPTMADVRGPDMLMGDLPSNMPQSTVPGAASSVQFAARQGRALIAKPGTPQDLSLASVELARTVERATPQMVALEGAEYANSVKTKVARFQQLLTSDPDNPDVPKLRKELYDTFKNLEETSRPMVERQLKQLRRIKSKQLPPGKSWLDVQRSELGLDIPDVPFQEAKMPEQSSSNGGWGIQRVP